MKKRKKQPELTQEQIKGIVEGLGLNINIDEKKSQEGNVSINQLGNVFKNDLKENELLENFKEKIRQAVRVSYSNPYDLGNIKKEDFENFLSNFQDEKFVINAKVLPTDYSKLIKKIESKDGISIGLEESYEGFMKKLKLIEFLYRNKENELKTFQVLNYLAEELRLKLQDLVQKIEKNPNDTYLKKKLEDTEKLEKFIVDLLEWRKEEINKLKKLREDKDRFIDEFLDDTGLKKLFQLLEKRENLSKLEIQFLEGLWEKIDEFVIDFTLEQRKKILEEGVNKYTEERRKILMQSKQFRQFIEQIDEKERVKLLNSPIHIGFFYSLYKLEKSIKAYRKEFFKELRERGIKVRNIFDKYFPEDIKEELIKLLEEKRFEDLKIRIKSLGLPKEIEKGLLVEIESFENGFKLLDVLKNESIFFKKKYYFHWYEKIMKYPIFAESQERYINLLTKTYNFDLMLEKIRTRKISVNQFEKILKTPQMLELPNKFKEQLKELVKENLAEGRKPVAYELSSKEYYEIVKGILEKKTANELLLDLKFKERGDFLKELKDTLGKDLNRSYSLAVRGLLLKTPLGGNSLASMLTDCVESKVLKGDTNISDCYKQIIEQESQKVRNLSAKVKEMLNMGLQGALFSPITFSMMVMAEIRRGMVEHLEKDYKYVQEKINRTLKEVIFNASDKERDLKVRMLGWEELGLWSEITDKNLIPDLRERVYVNLIKEELLEIIKKDEILDKVIENIATQKVEKEDQLELTRNLLANAIKNKDKELTLTLLKGLNEVFSKVKIDETFNREISKSIKEAIREFEKGEKLEVKPYKEHKVSQVYHLITKILDERLKTRGDKEEILKDLEETLKEVNKEVLIKSVSQKEKEEIVKQFRAEIEDFIPNNLYTLVERLKEARVDLKGGILEGTFREIFNKALSEEVERYLSELKSSSLVLEGKKKALLLVFKDLEREERVLLHNNVEKFLIQKLGVGKEEIVEKLNTDSFLHGLEYSLLYERKIDKEMWQSVKPKMEKRTGFKLRR